MKDFSAFQTWAAERLAFFRTDEYALEQAQYLGEFSPNDYFDRVKHALAINDADTSKTKEIVNGYLGSIETLGGEGIKLRIVRSFYVGYECIDSAISNSTCESYDIEEYPDMTEEDKAACEAMFPGELHFLGYDQVEFYFRPIGVVVDVPEKYFVAKP